MISISVVQAACGVRSAPEVRVRVEQTDDVDGGRSSASTEETDAGSAPRDGGSSEEPEPEDAGRSSANDADDASDAGRHVLPYVQVLSPVDGATVVNPVTFAADGAGIVSLRLSADGWNMRTWRPDTDGWSASYSFSGVGFPRAVLLEGLDESGTVIATDELTITVADGLASGDWGVQYADNLIENAATYLDEAWGDIEGGTPCVAFVSVGLRRHPDAARRFPDFYAKVTEGPASEPCDVQGRCSLEARGFTGPHTDARALRKGDICFTRDVAPFEGQLWPDHTYVFVEWETPGRTDYAWVIDNRQEFGTPYLRNITASSSSEFPFTPFQYFMRSPFVPAP